MGQRHLGILRGHRSPEAHASDRGISPGSTGHSRSLGVALPVPNHDESVTAFGREGDRLHQLREMGVGGVARSAAGRKPSRTTCRYHRNTERRSARIGQNSLVCVWNCCTVPGQTTTTGAICSMPAVSHLHFNAVTAEASTPKLQIARKNNIAQRIEHVSAHRLQTESCLEAQMLENMVEIHQQIVILCCCVQKLKIKRFRDTEKKDAYFPEICPL